MTITTIFGLITIFTLILLILGLIKPKLGLFGWKKASRWRVLLIVFPVFFFNLIVFSSYLEKDTEKVVIKNVAIVEGLVSEGKLVEAEKQLKENGHITEAYHQLFNEVVGEPYFAKKSLTNISDSELDSFSIESNRPLILKDYPALNKLLLQKIEPKIPNRAEIIKEVSKIEGKKRRLAAAKKLMTNDRCFELEYYFKKQMHDPSSFEHVNTIWSVRENNTIVINTDFRGKNKLGVLVKQAYVGTVSLDGKVLDLKVL